MSARWFKISTDLPFSLAAARLSGKEFRRQFIAALDGEENDLSPFITGPYVRPLAHEWRVIRERIFARDDYTCTYCGSRGVKLECDHIIPVSRGGSSEDSNLTTACKPCNRSKRSKTPEEWSR